jgi:hypothetical protein
MLSLFKEEYLDPYPASPASNGEVVSSLIEKSDRAEASSTSLGFIVDSNDIVIS